MTTYQVESSKYARGMAIVAPVDSSPTSPVAKLCEAFSGNRFSYREHGFMMNPVTLKHFMRAAQLGCKSKDGETVEWESPGAERFYRFSPKHPAKALRAIASRE